MTSPWRWNAKLKRYRDTKTGRFIGARQMRELRNQFVGAMHGDQRALNKRLFNKSLSAQDWLKQSWETIRATHVDLYVLARGGRKQMTPADWGRLGGILKFQRHKLQGFAQEIVDGRLSVAQIEARSQMYINAATHSYEQGQAAERGVKLPAYPGDGTSECLVNCKCSWRIVDEGEAWACTWVRSAKESCPTCLRRAQEWNPLRIPKRAARFRSDLDRLLGVLAGR